MLNENTNLEKTINVKVFRYDPTKDERPRYEDYEVILSPYMRVLGALQYIRDKYGVDIGFRHSCDMKACGQCAISINGKPALACFEAAEDGMVLEPLPNFPVIKDLFVDKSAYENRVKALRLFLHRRKAPNFPEKMSSEKIKATYELESKCIECMICTAACPLSEIKWRGFGGPYEFVQLGKFAFDPRDSLDRLPIALLEEIYDCSTCKRCKELCPSKIAIPDVVIERLRTMMFEDGIGPLPGHMPFIDLALKTGRVVEKQGTPLLKSLPDVAKVDDAIDRVGFFTGCLDDYRLQKVGNALVEVLKKNKVEVVIPKNQICCGSPLLRTGAIKGIEKFVKTNIESFEQAGVDTVVTACPGCAMTFRNNYPELAKGVFDREPKFKVLHISEYLTHNLVLNTKDLKPLNTTVTYHDPCHLNRGLGINREPREIIQSIPGIKLVEMERADACCGAGGGTRSGMRHLSYLIGGRKDERYRKTGANTLLTACPFCELQLTDIVKDTTTLDLVELLQKAYE